MNENLRAHLISGLVGDHVEQYQNSPEFYHAINTLAAMLPSMVDGLAASAAKHDEASVARLHEAMTNMALPVRWVLGIDGKA